MIAVVAIWAFAEALLWFVVADVPISAVGLRDGFGRAARASLVAALAAALGGLVMLHWAAAAPKASRAALDLVPGIGPGMIGEAAAAWEADGFVAMLAGAFAGVPYKLYAHAAGMAHAEPAAFVLMSVAARLPRFLMVSALSAILGQWLRKWLDPRQMIATFAGFWVLFYYAYFLAVGGAN
ncbi:MAG: hypothetical protein M0R03_07405 [Novosphingobium sp.]|nr:hypothetical protein [Novosphingobium sp.]